MTEGREKRMVPLCRDAEGNPTVWCDPEIADIVEALQGLGTIASCSGHGYRPGSVFLSDGRYLMIFDNQEQAAPAERAYPLDINGYRHLEASEAPLRAEIERKDARIETLEAALRDIAKQHLIAEMEDTSGDYEFAYECCVKVARQALEDKVMRQEEEQVNSVSARADRAVVNGAASVSTVPPSIPDAVADALEDYNSLLRTFSAVASRFGENTNWHPLRIKISATLEKHHSTWLEHSSFRRNLAQGIAAGTVETAQQVRPEGQKPGGDSHAPKGGK